MKKFNKLISIFLALTLMFTGFSNTVLAAVENPDTLPVREESQFVPMDADSYNRVTRAVLASLKADFVLPRPANREETTEDILARKVSEMFARAYNEKARRIGTDEILTEQVQVSDVVLGDTEADFTVSVAEQAPVVVSAQPYTQREAVSDVQKEENKESVPDDESLRTEEKDEYTEPTGGDSALFMLGAPRASYTTDNETKRNFDSNLSKSNLEVYGSVVKDAERLKKALEPLIRERVTQVEPKKHIVSVTFKADPNYGAPVGTLKLNSGNSMAMDIGTPYSNTVSTEIILADDAGSTYQTGFITDVPYKIITGNVELDVKDGSVYIDNRGFKQSGTAFANMIPVGPNAVYTIKGTKTGANNVWVTIGSSGKGDGKEDLNITLDNLTITGSSKSEDKDTTYGSGLIEVFRGTQTFKVKGTLTVQAGSDGSDGGFSIVGIYKRDGDEKSGFYYGSNIKFVKADNQNDYSYNINLKGPLATVPIYKSAKDYVSRNSALTIEKAGEVNIVGQYKKPSFDTEHKFVTHSGAIRAGEIDISAQKLNVSTVAKADKIDEAAITAYSTNSIKKNINITADEVVIKNAHGAFMRAIYFNSDTKKTTHASMTITATKKVEIEDECQPNSLRGSGPFTVKAADGLFIKKISRTLRLAGGVNEEINRDGWLTYVNENATITGSPQSESGNYQYEYYIYEIGDDALPKPDLSFKTEKLTDGGLKMTLPDFTGSVVDLSFLDKTSGDPGVTVAQEYNPSVAREKEKRWLRFPNTLPAGSYSVKLKAKAKSDALNTSDFSDETAFNIKKVTVKATGLPNTPREVTYTYVEKSGETISDNLDGTAYANVQGYKFKKWKYSSDCNSGLDISTTDSKLDTKNLNWGGGYTLALEAVYEQEAVQKAVSHTIKGEGSGKVDPAGTVYVNQGDTATLTITPDPHNKISGIKVTGS